MAENSGAMTRDSLKQILDDNKVGQSVYSLSGGHPSEAYVMDDRRSEWVVYYSERGLETGLSAFLDEDQACRHLLDLLLRDPTTRLLR